jgi:hypothetical protein
MTLSRRLLVLETLQGIQDQVMQAWYMFQHKFWLQTVLPNVVWEKAHCHDTKSNTLELITTLNWLQEEVWNYMTNQYVLDFTSP